MNPDLPCCPVLELRQYTLHPGQRDVLIELFEREFVETQEAVGMHLVGQFRDRDRPDRFVWIRGFADMPSRAKALQAFYGGPVWQAHREAANATMIDSDNVLLLRPVSADAAFAPATEARAPVGAANGPASRIVATICHFDAPVDDAFKRFFDVEIAPTLRPMARLETEHAENTFPRLPVRTGEHVFVWFERSDDDDARFAAIEPVLRKRLESAPERIVLEPTARSLLR